MFKSRKFRFFPDQIACWHIVSSPSTNLVYYPLHHFFADGSFLSSGPWWRAHNVSESSGKSSQLRGWTRSSTILVGEGTGNQQKNPKKPNRNVLLFKFLVILSFIFLIPLVSPTWRWHDKEKQVQFVTVWEGKEEGYEHSQKKMWSVRYYWFH